MKKNISESFCCQDSKRNGAKCILTPTIVINLYPNYSFLPARGAMLARVLAMAMCLSVCPTASVTSRCSVERAGRIELDRRRSTKLTTPPSSDARRLVYHSDRQALSTARFRRACQSATAELKSFGNVRHLFIWNVAQIIQRVGGVYFNRGVQPKCGVQNSVLLQQIRKIVKIVATICQILRLKCTKIQFRLGLCLRFPPGWI